MPNIINVRALNIKIVKRIPNFNGATYSVYNYTNGARRTFPNVRSMIAYHSPNAKYINYDTSQILNRETYNWESNKIVFVKYRNEAGLLVNQLINGSPITMESFEENNDNLYQLPVRPALDSIRRELTTRTGWTTTPSGVAINSGIAINSGGRIHREVERPQPTEEVNRNLIYSYHTSFNINCKQAQVDIDNNNRRFFGFELEVDGRTNGNGVNNHRLATKLNKILNNDNYNTFCKFERDGSLSSDGVEIITQPMTYNYINEHKEQLKEAMHIIDSENYTSHDNGRCGLHIHVSRTEIPSDTLDKIILIFENFKNEMIAFSRRTESGMRWARFITDNVSASEIDDEFVKVYKSRGNMSGHSCVINNQNTNTVEFRLFRGTTNLTTLFASIQLIDNIITIAQQKQTIEDITWDQIINWNMNHEELIKYNAKRNIISTHKAKNRIIKQEVCNRGVILVRPFQMHLEGDRD